MNWPNTRASALGKPQLVQLMDGTEEETDAASLTDWRTEYGGVLNPRTGEIELPTQTFAPCPYPDCTECAEEASNGHR
ncbi:hypothetical protein IAG44_17755 [Streptomyces roseirectus]|uniref:Uncharacterized protein n=1 Tax=Streptomyces roseirectus TaxID=2768066 RepID=A0A7H0IE84_9ACTN|nr:hypothetical protein [Streptomyces roseirectus]QNP71100.1 hypothetical protein IAG44_17755 [Streptomyces roseirectus]